MIVDLHVHYPMHLKATITRVRRRPHDSVEQLVRGLAMDAAAALFNSPLVVTVDSLQRGGVGVAFSALYQPFNEMDLSLRYGSLPRARYFNDLLALIDGVEADLLLRDTQAVVVKNSDELGDVVRSGRLAVIHTVEGGFHIGDTESDIRVNTRELAHRGVASITIAHLFFRQVATNAPAIPIMSDDLYHRLCPQPLVGLHPLGRALIETMVEQGMLIDVTHLSAQGFQEVAALLDELDPEGTVPLIASHGATALGGDAEYNLTEDQLRTIGRRKGVVGLIMCEHWMAMGRPAPKSRKASLALICEHIDRIATVTDGYDCIGIGSDHDGFIRPTLKGFEGPADLRYLEAELKSRYGLEVSEMILSRNALRVLASWGDAGGSFRGSRFFNPGEMDTES